VGSNASNAVEEVNGYQFAGQSIDKQAVATRERHSAVFPLHIGGAMTHGLLTLF
jgi:hypothetical protein